jgi:FHA domain
MSSTAKSIVIAEQPSAPAIGVADPSAVKAPVLVAQVTQPAIDQVDDTSDTVDIELNFNAFADNVPPTTHARRVASYADPSVQDFADQALELATLRAEVKRLTRDYDSLRQLMRLRDQRLHGMQEEIAMYKQRVRRVEAAPVSAEQPVISAMERTAKLPEVVEAKAAEPAEVVVEKSSSTVELPAPAFDPVATIVETSPVVTAMRSAAAASGRRLIPMGHQAVDVVLDRDVMTVGRTKASDVCIRSGGVSRDHARLLTSARGVTLIDMESANGCFVNEEPVKKQGLRDGDIVRIGDRSFRFADL